MHAVLVRDDDGLPIGFDDEAVLALGGLDDLGSPWAAVAGSGEELFVAVDQLDEPARSRATARGLTHLRARPVPDPLRRTHAVVVMARAVGSPLPADRSALEFSWFALDKMATVLELALTWRDQVVELRQAASTDPLTGLANRAGFWSQCRQVGDDGDEDRTVGLLCIDLDRFKPVNDTHGHAVGDALLVAVADRLRAILRSDDLVARLGGDEFAVVLRHLGDRDPTTVADRVMGALAEPFAIGGHEISIGASVGIAAAPAWAFDADHLLDAADGALYDAKAGGRSRWVQATVRPVRPEEK